MNVRQLKTIRWAFNVKRWQPTELEWSRAVQLIQMEEKQRIEKFRYRVDMVASLVGRLLLRCFAVQALGLHNKDIKFVRTDRGKPVLEQDNQGWDYNVSHAGDWVVLAASHGAYLGVDVMRTKDNRVERLEEFFRLMRRQFTDDEWITINGNEADTDEQKLARFFRHWTLKESYVKAVGTGLNLDLRTLNFKLKHQINQQDIITSTMLEVNNQLTPWRFEESILDDEHVVSVAVHRDSNHQHGDDISQFEKLTILNIFTYLTNNGQEPVTSQLLRHVEPKDFQFYLAKDHPKPF